MMDFHSREKMPESRPALRQRLSETLLRGVGFRVWDVAPNDIQYQYDQGHTLSLYLKGGEQTFRSDKPHLKGQSGKLCLMPQDHLSRWHCHAPIRIAHLYLPDALIRQEAERHLDIDARRAELKDLVYQNDADLSNAMLRLICAINNNEGIDPLFAEQSLYEVSSALLERYRQESCKNSPATQGFSTEQRRFIRTYIKRNLGEKLTLEMLASQLQLSPFHFARLFRQSFGDSPASYIIRQRIELAQALLAGNKDLAFIALECGFSHQSHFNNYFKKQIGMTPARYRKLT